MSEYNPFENSAPGVSLHEVNNAPAKSAEPAVAAAPAPPVNPPYEPYIPSASPAYQPNPYQPTPAPGGVIPDGSSVHYSSGAYAGAPAARYDLAGNPLPPEPYAAAPQPQYAPPPSPYGGGAPAPPPYGYAGAPAYGAPGAPYGSPQAPYGAPQGAWPPPPGRTGSSLFDMQEANTSGQQGSVPPEIDRLRWNWGAYFLPVLWCRWHGMTSVAAALAATSFALRFLRILPSPIHPVFYALYSIFWFSVSLYMGFNGHKMAWRNRRYFGGVEEHLKVQRAWLIGGLVAGPVAWIALVIFLISIVAASAPSHSFSPSGSGSSFGTPAGGDNGDSGSDTAPPAGAPGPSDPSANPMYNGPAAAAPAPDNAGASAPAPASADDTPAPTGFHPTN